VPPFTDLKLIHIVPVGRDIDAPRLAAFEPMVEIDVLLVGEPFGVLRICKACRPSRRLIEKWRDAAAMINIAAKKQP
jgi:hypothetical protein